MDKEGYWVKPTDTQQNIDPQFGRFLLAQLGASASEDKRVAQACNYVLDHMAECGQFTTTTSGAPSGTVDCLQGNLCWSLMELGCDDPHLDKAYEWMARTVTGDGIAPMEDKDAPSAIFASWTVAGWNNKLLRVGRSQSHAGVQQTVGPKANRAHQESRQTGRGLFLRHRSCHGKISHATYEKTAPVVRLPVFYVTICQLAETLVIRYGNDKRLTNTLDIIKNKMKTVNG
jgi:hypothetical protein